MNCDLHPDYSAIYWRKGLYDPNLKIYMCLSCGNEARDISGLKIHKIEYDDSLEHCECGARTGGGRCITCNDLRDKELSSKQGDRELYDER